MGLNVFEEKGVNGSAICGEEPASGAPKLNDGQALHFVIPIAQDESRPIGQTQDWLDSLSPHSAEACNVALRWTLPVFDMLVILLGFTYVFQLTSASQGAVAVEFASAAAAGWVLAGCVAGIYGPGALRLNGQRMAMLGGVWALVVALLWGGALYTSINLSSEIWASLLATGAVGLLLVRLSVWVFAGRIILRGDASRQIVIVGNSVVARFAADRVLSERPDATISAVIDPSLAEQGLKATSSPLPADEIVLALDPNDPSFDRLGARLRQFPVAVSWIGQENETGLIRLQSRPLSGGAQITKRIFDLVVSSALLLVFAPLMLLLGALIKCSDPTAPVFYMQRRHGFNQKTFVTYKFRTMRADPNGDRAQQATAGDPRVTRLGHFLRASSIDELPQLVNVFAGDMSIVGPRPHPVWLNERFSSVLNGYLARHRVKPGITGLAQVNGLRGETDTTEKMKKRVEMDLLYIEQWSLWLDLAILAKTATAIFKSENAY